MTLIVYTTVTEVAIKLMIERDDLREELKRTRDDRDTVETHCGKLRDEVRRLRDEVGRLQSRVVSPYIRPGVVSGCYGLPCKSADSGSEILCPACAARVIADLRDLVTRALDNELVRAPTWIAEAREVLGVKP